MAPRRVRSIAFGMVVLGLFASACSVQDTLAYPGCSSGSGILAAQSVPTGELVPCLDGLPDGWDVARVRIDQDGLLLELDSDRAGDAAAKLHYVQSCDTGAAVPVPSDQIDADRFDYIERVSPGFSGQWYYLFGGGCAWWDFRFGDGVSASLSVELGDRFQLLSRVLINDNIRQTFIDKQL